ncbi:MAG: copper chaperone PCu(A)C [Actinomycetota bacterium]
MKTVLGTVLALLLSVSAAWAGDIQVKNAWARSAPTGAVTGAAFLTIVNTGKQADRLLGASTPAARMAELHMHVMEGDVARMAALSSVDVFAGQTVAFAPGSLHVMLVGLTGPLAQGSHFPLTLEFANAGNITVDVAVLAPGAMGGMAPMDDDAHRAMHESHMQDPAHRAMHEQMHGSGK